MLSLSVCSNARHLVSGSRDGRLIVWSVEMKRKLRLLDLEGEWGAELLSSSNEER